MEWVTEGTMQKHAWLYGLRGIKLFILVIAVFVASVCHSIVFSRPARAESFLHRTVACVVTLFVRCDTSIQKPGAPAPVLPEPALPPVTPTEEATNSGEAATRSQAPASTMPARSTPPLTTPPLSAEFEEVAQPVAPVPDVPKPTHRTPFTYGSATYMAYMYGNAQRDVAVANPERAPARATPDGWYVFGVAWYWWMAGVAAVAGVGYAAKRLFIRKITVLPNES